MPPSDVKVDELKLTAIFDSDRRIIDKEIVWYEDKNGKWTNDHIEGKLEKKKQKREAYRRRQVSKLKKKRIFPNFYAGYMRPNTTQGDWGPLHVMHRTSRKRKFDEVDDGHRRRCCGPAPSTIRKQGTPNPTNSVNQKSGSLTSHNNKIEQELLQQSIELAKKTDKVESAYSQFQESIILATRKLAENKALEEKLYLSERKYEEQSNWIENVLMKTVQEKPSWPKLDQQKLTKILRYYQLQQPITLLLLQFYILIIHIHTTPRKLVSR